MLVSQVVKELSLLTEDHLERALLVLTCWYQEQEEHESVPDLELLVFGNSLFSTSLYEPFIESFYRTRMIEKASTDEITTLFFDNFGVLGLDVIEDCTYLLNLQEMFFQIDGLFFHKPAKGVW